VISLQTCPLTVGKQKSDEDLKFLRTKCCRR